jgi:hypothetical protein
MIRWLWSLTLPSPPATIRRPSGTNAVRTNTNSALRFIETRALDCHMVMTCLIRPIPKLQTEGLRESSPGLGSLGDRHPGSESGTSSDPERVEENNAWSAIWRGDGGGSATLSGSKDISYQTQGVARQGSLTLGLAHAPLQGAAAVHTPCMTASTSVSLLYKS